MRTRLLLLAVAGPAFAQLPQIDSTGVVNAASWSQPVSPGALAAVFGSHLASAQQYATPPYPTALAGTSVAVNGVAAPLLFVSPGQINFQMPSAVANSQWFTIVSAQIVVTTAAGSNAPVTFPVGSTPGLFTADGSGCGQAAALNIRADGSVSVNSASNSAAPGDSIALYGTGFGFSATQPPDGAGSPGPAPLQTPPGLLLDQTLNQTPMYAGLAPRLAGVDQINFQVPPNIRNGCAVPVTASAGLSSPTVTIAVNSARGQCADPPIQSYESISLNELTVTDSAGLQMPPRASFSAIFPASPGLQPPAIQRIVFAPAWMNASGPSAVQAVLSPFPLAPRVCPIPGYSHLSAGAIRLQPPIGAPITINPTGVNPDVPAEGVSYAQSLPAGPLLPGTYAISTASDSPVSVNTTIQVGAPVQVQTSLTPGTTISQSRPLTVTWTGGDANSLVRLTLTSTQSIESHARATDGSITIQPVCTAGTGGPVCSFGLPNATDAQISIAVVPANPQTISATGITGPVQLSWMRTYVFTGLTLAP